MEANEQTGSDGDGPSDAATASPDADATDPGPAPTDGQPERDLDGVEGDRLEPEGLTLAEKRLLGGLAAAGLAILLVILAVNVFSGGDSDEPGPSDAADVASGAEGDPVENPAVVPTVETLSATTEPVVDAFDRDTLDGGQLGWTTLGEGEWTVSDGSLRSGTEPEGVSTLAVTEVPEGFGADWAFAITVEQAGQSSGFVWGVDDDENYWEMRVNTEYAVVVINHVQDGTPNQIKTLGPAGFAESSRYGIQHEGDTVTMAANGEPFLSLTDDSLSEPRKVGVIASSDAPGSFKLAEVANIEAAG